MARIRTIKPEFFLHERLAELSALHRLLFIGLWTLADRDGRLEDRPKRIKAAILPYDNRNVDIMLGELHEHGFITRYDGPDGGDYIEITAFSKHQRVGGREAGTPSEYPPPPPGIIEEALGKQSGSDGEALGSAGREGKGREGNKEGKGREDAGASNGADAPRPTRPVPVPNRAYLDIVEAWNVEARQTPEWVEVSAHLDDKPRQRINAALRSLPDIGAWEARFARAVRSSHLTGRNGKGFVADFWWLLDHVAELDAGRYDDRERTPAVADAPVGEPPAFVPPGAPGRDAYDEAMIVWQQRQEARRWA